MELVKAVFNGKFDSLENIQVSPLSRAYTFSDSVYEVVPFYNASPIAYDNHIKRLQYSQSALSMKIHLNPVTEEIKRLISSCESKRYI
jgi:D-alanine transaminase